MAIERQFVPATPVDGLVEMDPEVEVETTETEDGGMIVDFDPNASQTMDADFNSNLVDFIDEDDFSSLGISGTVEEQVKRLADLAIRSRLDGLVCSAKELKMIKEYVKDDLLLVTPGIRPSGGNVNDQKRIVTPSTAIKDGADFLVIGRPITDEKNPKVALDKICSEI